MFTAPPHNGKADGNARGAVSGVDIWELILWEWTYWGVTYQYRFCECTLPKLPSLCFAHHHSPAGP